MLEVIKTSFDESIESIERWTRVKITKEQAREIVIESAKDFNEFYEIKFPKEKHPAQKRPLLRLNEGWQRSCNANGSLTRGH